MIRSFSAEDVAFFFEHGQEASIASDDRYVYVMRRTADTPELTGEESMALFEEKWKSSEVLGRSFSGELDIDHDGFDCALRILSEELSFEYERTKNSQLTSSGFFYV